MEEVGEAVGRSRKEKKQRWWSECGVLGGRPVTMLSLGGVDVLEVEPVERTMREWAGRRDDSSIAGVRVKPKCHTLERIVSS